jgi:cytoskeleton protein RodZ
MPTLGEELRRVREEKGMNLREVSDATHIGSRFLQAIESDNYSILPGGIFNRGFVRSYARYVGMDEEQAMVLYNQQLESQGGEAPRSPASSLDGIEEGTSSPWGSIALIVITLLLLSAGIFTAWKWFKGGEALLAGGATAASALPSASSEAATPSPSASVVTSPTVGASPSAIPSPSAGVSPSATPMPGAMQLKLQAKDGECWIKIRTDANPKSEMATLKPGEYREVSANERFIVNVGNILTLNAYLNGKPITINANKGKFIAEGVLITKDNQQLFVPTAPAAAPQ